MTEPRSWIEGGPPIRNGLICAGGSVLPEKSAGTSQAAGAVPGVAVGPEDVPAVLFDALHSLEPPILGTSYGIYKTLDRTPKPPGMLLKTSACSVRQTKTDILFVHREREWDRQKEKEEESAPVPSRVPLLCYLLFLDSAIATHCMARDIFIGSVMRSL